MGYNTAVLILNDALSDLKKDADVGRKLSNAILVSQSAAVGRATDFSIGCHANGGTVLPSEHADHVQIVALGGNSMRRLAILHYEWSKMTDPEKLMRSLADTLGYTISKKVGA